MKDKKSNKGVICKMAMSMEQAFLNAGYPPVKPRKARERKVQKCRKCGAAMQLIEDTNVMICTGDIEIKDEDGNTREVPCNNRFIFTSKNI